MSDAVQALAPKFPAPASEQALRLPVYTQHDALIEAIRHHQVVVVEGPTGCGKTTQLPAMLLRAGMTDKCIAVTQPRRIAAVSVAWRIAEETAATLGREVGYAIRFDDQSGPDTRIRLCTDGILLQEARFAPDFDRYGIIVVDEAHERSLNIDFLLGLLHDAVLRRADLRVVVSSATIDPGRFVRFFEDVLGPVPVVRIDARPHPVTMQYRPLDSGNADQLAFAMATEAARIDKAGLPGHILCFLSGEDAIKRTQKAMQNAGLGKSAAIMPLYGALTREEQERVFANVGKRKIILATNIAETSITIDDVRFVFDSGIAKVPRVQARSGVTILREEGISRASADQRAGRAGRTAPGICIRFYDERSYRARPQFTDEEILRLDLAEVALRLLDLGIKDLEHFAFPTPPPRGRLFAALDTLYALGAIDSQRNLLDMGRKMAAYPLSPALARMVLEAAMHTASALSDVCVVAAWLSSRSPMSMPPGQEDAARKAHGSWAHPLGDLVAALRCFRAWQRAHDRNKFCQQHYLDGHLLAFIDSAHNQLLRQAHDQGFVDTAGDEPGDPNHVARAVLAGFASNVLQAQGRFYETPDGDRVLLFPGSCLYPQGPRFVVAAEIVVGNRPYARMVTAIRGSWLAEVRPELVPVWGLQKDRPQRTEQPAPGPMPVPRQLLLGGVTLQVDDKKGKPRLDILASQIPQLKDVLPTEVPAEALRWQCRLLVGTQPFATGTALGVLLPVLGLLPLPLPGERLDNPVPEGALLELDRNRHALLHHLDHVLQPAAQTGGKRNGWVMLVANGGGGYWYEVSPDFRDALQTTLPSLQQLAEDLENDPDGVQVAPTLQRVQALHEQATEAWERFAKVKVGRRG